MQLPGCLVQVCSTWGSAVVQGLGATPIPDRRNRVAILPQALVSVAALQRGLPAQVYRLVRMNPAPSLFFCSGCNAHRLPIPSVLASGARPRCGSMASADPQETQDGRG